MEPWTRPEMIADGADIWQYMADTAHKHGIDEHIRLKHPCQLGRLGLGHRHLDRARRSGRRAQDLPRPVRVLRHRLLQLRRAVRPPFRGIEDFTGEVVHPQHWPEGSGLHRQTARCASAAAATAVSMIPSLTESAHVTMLQRTPSYLFPVAAGRQPVFQRYPESCCRAELPTGLHARSWRCSVRRSGWSPGGHPGSASVCCAASPSKNLPAGYDIDTHFTPPYNPWDQRMCFILGGDLYRARRWRRATSKG